MSSDKDTIIVCTKDELIAMHEAVEVNGDEVVIGMDALFEVLCEHYGVDSHWQPNDVY